MSEAPERRASDAPPRTGAPWDKCKRCGRATDYRVSDQKKDKKGNVFYFENWSCGEGCGWWWKKKGSDYKPEWRDSK